MSFNLLYVLNNKFLLKLIVLLLFFSHSLQAQFNISGIVKDAKTLKSLAFTTIKLDSGEKIISDIDGKFTINKPQQINFIEISYVGFISSKIDVIDKNFYQIILFRNYKLTLLNYDANEIIKKVVNNKNNNNPEKKLINFRFKSYNKLIITANPDSLRGKIDSVFINKNNYKYFSKLDSSEYKFKKIIEKQHLFHSEKVSEFLFKDKKLKENVLAIKMSGFKQPVYEILGLNLQSFSVYNNVYELLQTKYKSPISDDKTSDYSYKLLDTISINNRQTLAIYFKNRKKINQSGLEGLLYIDIENYAIANAVMRVKNVIDITGVHNFEYIKKEKIWFPKSQIFKIIKGKNNEDVKIFGGTFQFDSDLDDNNNIREKHSSDYVNLLSETTNTAIEFNKVFDVRRSAIAIEVKDEAVNKPEKFWNSFRKDSLDLRSKKTYQTLDSLVVKRKIEKRFLFGKKIINGFVPISAFDLDLRKFFNFNNYEGFRFSLAGITNEKLSKKFRIETYTAYGAKDGNFKYNLGFAGRYGKFSNTWFGASYTDDVNQIASTSFAIENKQFKLFDTDLFNFSSFYNYVKWRTFIETRIIPKTESIWEISQTNIIPKFDYLFKTNNQTYSEYKMTTAMVSLQWKPFSKYIQTPIGRNEISEGFPVFNIQLTKSLPGITQNDFDFSKIDFKTSYERTFLNGQKTNLMFAFGYAFGNIPITHLYNNSPNSLNKDKILQRISIEGDNDFETMYLNEFFSNKYAFFEFRHGLRKFNITKKFKPNLVFITRLAIGNISKPEQHIGIEYKTLDSGYFESGMQINQLFKGLGISSFFRYGPNQLPEFEDNLAIRISYYFNLGF